MRFTLGLLIPLLGLSCRSSELQTPQNPNPHATYTSSQTSGSDTDPSTTDLDAKAEEKIAPPHNISGQYLIGCSLDADNPLVNKSPAMAAYHCRVEDTAGAPLMAEGMWTAELREPLAGESLQTSDSQKGHFLLSSAQPEGLSAALGRTSVHFQGTIEGHELSLHGSNLGPLVSNLLTLQQSLPLLVSYEFTVKIVSGTLSGQSYRGTFAYDQHLLKQQGLESIKASTLQFAYVPSMQNFDGQGNLSFNNGSFVALTFSGGPSNQRFGINTGFDRNQFGRSSEAFVRNGDQYFGYLNASAIVDGAGMLSYLRK